MTLKHAPVKRTLIKPLNPSLPPLPAKPTADDIETALFEQWIDGILVLTHDGRWIYSNGKAQRICDRIAQEQPCVGQIPQGIWDICQVLIQRGRTFAKHPLTTESELMLQDAQECFRVRARWLKVSNYAEPFILVMLENQKRARQNLASTEIIRYCLSPREADVWILHRMGLSYQEISEKLYIAINTVKKHMKNAYAKQTLASMLDGETYTDKLAG
ncbi:MAG: LuxR C-terminal-related transcriptional regulator [Cyanobacteria bacterium P01_F01_bin.116]